jgi:FkbM family methyltransferase
VLTDASPTVSFSYRDSQIAELLAEFADPRVREAIELSSLGEILQDVTYFIDVGSNVGQYVFHAARHLRNAKIVAIEANPLIIPILTKTIEALRSQDCAGNRYEVRAAAASDIPGNIEFHISRLPTLSSVTPNTRAETVRVPTVCLNELYLPSTRTFIKMDIEGAEYRAIRSGSRFLESTDTSFFVELHSWGDWSIGKYPLHVCWLFFTNRFASKKIGTHYLFYKASWLKSMVSFARELPGQLSKYLWRRLGGALVPFASRRKALN